jgi:chemotaxis protein MotB
VREDRFLASNRATNVLVYIQEHSVVDPARLVSEGLGQWRPIESNDTEEGRSKNRRVEMIISGRNLAEELDSSIQEYSTSISTSTSTEASTDVSASVSTDADTSISTDTSTDTSTSVDTQASTSTSTDSG